jgi:hypothetical protein
MTEHRSQWLVKGNDMKRLTIFAGALALAFACFVSIIALSSPSSGQAGGGIAANSPPAPFAREVWVALRSDGQAGSGTVTDPFDASTPQKLDAMFSKFTDEYGDNLTIHLGPGVFHGRQRYSPCNNWKVRGAGRDITVLRTLGDLNAFETIGFRPDGRHGNPSGVEISDLTFDFNVAGLRKANRVCVYFEGREPRVLYHCVQSAPEWSQTQPYKRSFDSVVTHKGLEYICIPPTPTQGKEPAQGEFWSVLRPCDASKLPAWEKDKPYAVGEACALDGKGYLCVAAAKTNPAADKSNWRAIRTDAPDPRIYTHAAFLTSDSPGGHNRIVRAKAVGPYSSAFFDREDFVFGVGGDDSTIEDCQVYGYSGDSATQIAMFDGQNSVIRNCTVRGNDSDDVHSIGIGGWALQDATFENNFCDNVDAATNIDSLSNRNVTFRGNTFMRCRKVGLLVNVHIPDNAVIDPAHPPTPRIVIINGKPVDVIWKKMDGLFIYDNHVEVLDDCPFGGIQTQQSVLNNVKIYNNVIRTYDGKGHGRRAIGVLGKPGMNVQISDNTCDPDMYCEIGVPAFGWGNVDLQGKPIKGLEKLTRPGQ